MTNRKLDGMKAAFGRRLTAARMAAGFATAADMARETGIPLGRYRRYERGENVPPLDDLEAIMRVSDQTSDWLFLGSPTKTMLDNMAQALADIAAGYPDAKGRAESTLANLRASGRLRVVPR